MTTPNNPTRGGSRKGAGRKKKAKKAVTVSVSLSPQKIAVIDAMRGSRTRGRTIADLVPDG